MIVADFDRLHPVVCARQVRQKLGFKTPVNLVAAANVFSLDVQFLRLSPSITGALILESGLIVANHQSRWRGRTRFAVAHELGHFLLHRRVRKYFLCSRDVRGFYERQADMFAVELLMPFEEVRGLAGEMPFELLASHFGVSLEAMDIRLLELSRAVGA